PPTVIADRLDVFVVEVRRVHQLAVNIELQLVMGGIPDPDRSRPAIPLQVVQRFFLQFGPAIDAVHQLQWPVAGTFGLFPTRLRPALESLRLFRKTDPQQGVKSEGRVADPGVTIVPIAPAADRFRQAARGSRYDRPRWLEGEQLQRESRAV